LLIADRGGNITGLFVQQVELAAKRVQLIHEAVPARKLDLLFDAASGDQAKAAQDAAGRLDAEPRLVEVEGQPPNYIAALNHLSIPPGDAVVITESPVFVRDRSVLMRQLLERQIPAIGAAREDAEAGALMSYGVNIIDTLRHAADYVNRIANGTKPSELPIEQPTKFELVINLRTAKALGLTIPLVLLARAEEILE
jgi:putative tryptophan/tyrosine transport system substrate-binding protein